MATEKNTKNRLRKIALWLLVSLIILSAGIYSLRSVLIAPHAITYFERAIEANLGLRISIGELSGSYFSNLAVKNVTTVKRRSDSPLTNLQIKQLKLTYRLWDIFSGLPAFLAGIAIDIEQAQLAADLTAQTGSGNDKDAPQGIQLPPLLPRIRISNSSIRLKDAGYETRFDGISLATRTAEAGKSLLQLRVTQWSLKHPAWRDIAVALEADLAYSRESLKIENLLVDQRLLVKSAAMGLRGLPDDIPFEMRLNPAGGQLNADGRVAANRLQVALSGSGLDLSRISGLLAPPSVPFGGRLALQGQLDLPFSDPRDMVGNLAIQLADGSLNETTVEQLAFRITAGDRLLGVADLQLVNDANRLRISRASIAADVLYGSDLAAILQSLSVDWRLEASDVPALLGLFGLTFAAHTDRIPAHSLRLNGRMAGADLIISEGDLDAGTGHVRLKAAHIALPIGERTLKESTMAGDLSVDLPDLAILSRIFALPALGGSLQGQIKASGTLQDPRGAADLAGRALTYSTLR